MTALEIMSKQEARRLTDEIKRDMESLWHKVREAYERRAWESLGYSSWEGYCGAEFDTDHLKIPRDERPAIVASLRDAGMSTRAIAVATGVTDITVRRDLAGATNVAPQITGTDGKTYAATRPKADDTDNMRPTPEAAVQGARSRCMNVHRAISDLTVYMQTTWLDDKEERKRIAASVLEDLESAIETVKGIAGRNTQ